MGESAGALQGSVDGTTVVVVLVGDLVRWDGARVAGTDAGQQRAGGDEVGYAHQRDPGAVEVDLAELRLPQELQP